MAIALCRAVLFLVGGMGNPFLTDLPGLTGFGVKVLGIGFKVWGEQRMANSP